jgi:hypothetical protein
MLVSIKECIECCELFRRMAMSRFLLREAGWGLDARRRGRRGEVDGGPVVVESADHGRGDGGWWGRRKEGGRGEKKRN